MSSNTDMSTKASVASLAQKSFVNGMPFAQQQQEFIHPIPLKHQPQPQTQQSSQTTLSNINLPTLNMSKYLPPTVTTNDNISITTISYPNVQATIGNNQDYNCSIEGALNNGISKCANSSRTSSPSLSINSSQQAKSLNESPKSNQKLQSHNQINKYTQSDEVSQLGLTTVSSPVLHTNLTPHPTFPHDINKSLGFHVNFNNVEDNMHNLSINNHNMITHSQLQSQQPSIANHKEFNFQPLRLSGQQQSDQEQPGKQQSSLKPISFALPNIPAFQPQHMYCQSSLVPVNNKSINANYLSPTVQETTHISTPTIPLIPTNRLNNNVQPMTRVGSDIGKRHKYPINIQQVNPTLCSAYKTHQQPTVPMQPISPVGFNSPNIGSMPLQYQNQLHSNQQNQMAQQNISHQQQQSQQFQTSNVIQSGFNGLWGQDAVDLIQNRHILSPVTLQLPKIVLHNQFLESINCNPNILRCTITKIPESNSLLQKSRLPLGIIVHPFRDVNSLPVIQCPNIVRCRLCRTYINPFIYFMDSKMWKCNLCYRVNELPDDFQFDPATKTYGDVTRRPEVRSSTIEFIAPTEYMLRPPQPAIYLFLFDVSIIAQQCGYLENVCTTLGTYLDDIPGDARTRIGFIAFNSHIHFYSMAEGYNQPHEMTLIDIDDPFIPRPDNLLVNLKECKELVKDLLKQMPKRFIDTHDPGSALGSALQVAYKLMQASGGRVTVFQTCLPNKGPGALGAREDPNNRSAKDVAHLNPATDFYKRYSLECSGYQIAVDLFLLNQQYSDLATIAGISKHSGGCIYHFPLYQKTKPQDVDSLMNCLKRYLTRKIGFEAVMRIRCTRGLQVHTFHGNFFVRSTDLLSLPNVNPDAGYGMQITYEESLFDVRTVCFQVALLYTNSEGERRIRVHTLCLPVTASLPEIMHSADVEAIIGLLSKMAVDRSLTSNVVDAREAFINATVDVFNAFKIAQNLPTGQSGQLIAPRSLALMPLYILALLKHTAFRIGMSTRLDDRVFAMDCMKTLPLDQLLKFIYPELYNIDPLFYNTAKIVNNHTDSTDNDIADDNEDEDTYEDEDDLPELKRLQLTAEFLDSRSIFLMDCGTMIMIYVGLNVPSQVMASVFGIQSTAEIPDYVYGLPSVTQSAASSILKRFIMKLNDEKPYYPVIQIIRDTSTAKSQFIERLIDDRSESSLSYYEFLQHIRTQVK